MIIKTAHNRLTITRKMSGAGSIYDLASDQFDRTIKFAPQCVYAIVLPAYYGGKGYTTHKTEQTTIKAAHKLQRQGYAYNILDLDGNSYDVAYDKLIRTL